MPSARSKEQQRQREQELPVEGSWRMVEGENDSFGTSIIPDLDYDNENPVSSGISHLSSQGNLSSIGASQESSHSIQDFVTRAEDERVILRTPFRPSIPSMRQTSFDRNRTPDPEFHMPSMHVESPTRGGSGRSSRTIRPPDERGLRRRPPQQARSKTKRTAAAYSGNSLDEDDEDAVQRPVSERISAALPGALVSILAWCLDIIGTAFKMLKYPLAIGLAVYLLFGGLIILQTMVTRSFYASISPLCRVPGVQLLGLPFCPKFGDETIPVEPVEFDDLMDVQYSFEQVLERSVDGVSLPLEMKRSEMTIRDLRSMVRLSDLTYKDELVLEFDQYVDTVRLTSRGLQKFNIHVGGAVDSVISINRYTSRYLDTLNGPESTSREIEPSSVGRWASWLFYPFQPATMPIFEERVLLEKYIQHTTFVSDKIAALLAEAEAVLGLLTKAEDNLSVIHEIVTRSREDVKSKRDDVFWDIWTLVGGNKRKIHNLKSQLDVLRNISNQRSEAIAQVSALVVELQKIEAGLSDLRDRIIQPSLEYYSDEAGSRTHGNIPLAVHIETIDRGVERLDEVRKRLRAVEDEKYREALKRGGLRQEEPLIEGRR